MSFDRDEKLTGFRFIDTELLVDFIQSLLCPNCRKPLGQNRRKACVTEERSVLASTFVFRCQCQHSVTLKTSRTCGKTYEVSRRFPLSMFSIGKNLKQARKFLGSMNMPYTFNKEVWYQHKDKITKATETVATNSKTRAATEIKQSKGRDTAVSNDGTWQRKGFQSKNGVVTKL